MVGATSLKGQTESGLDKHRCFSDPLTETQWRHVQTRYRLCPREIGICRGIVMGLDTKSLAREMHLAIETIRGYVKSVLHKTGVPDRLALTLMILHDFRHI